MTLSDETRPVVGHSDCFAVRRALPGDRAALEAMFSRCDLQTRYRRFHAPVHVIPETYLTAVLSGQPDFYALVAFGPCGTITALASAHITASGISETDAMEIGILVEDTSQRRGLGRLLLERIVGEARHRGIRVIEAVILREQTWILRQLRAYGAYETASGHGVIAVTLWLP